jgi:hypothetical protein
MSPYHRHQAAQDNGAEAPRKEQEDVDGLHIETTAPTVTGGSTIDG